MSSLFREVQPAVKKETRRVCVMTLTEMIIMWIVFAILHIIMPETVPFDYTVILGGIVGSLITVLNFFLMGMMVQRAVSCEDEDSARSRVKASYSQRLLLQMLWVVVAIVAPCFHFAAGIIPLFFPSIGIKLTGIVNRKNQNEVG
ncbi:MAG: hypothetical protein LUI07_01355 [Lachnospiraceae bacterium]|nr:hypothetical protein [Lachnospiraceae bacterium]